MLIYRNAGGVHGQSLGTPELNNANIFSDTFRRFLKCNFVVTHKKWISSKRSELLHSSRVKLNIDHFQLQLLLFVWWQGTGHQLKWRQLNFYSKFENRVISLWGQPVTCCSASRFGCLPSVWHKWGRWANDLFEICLNKSSLDLKTCTFVGLHVKHKTRAGAETHRAMRAGSNWREIRNFLCG